MVLPALAEPGRAPRWDGASALSALRRARKSSYHAVDHVVHLRRAQLAFKPRHAFVRSLCEGIQEHLVAAPGLPVGIGEVGRARAAHSPAISAVAHRAALLVG